MSSTGHPPRYQVERDDPLRVFSTDLPASVEVLAIEDGGNQTITEARFRTR